MVATYTSPATSWCCYFNTVSQFLFLISTLNTARDVSQTRNHSLTESKCNSLKRSEPVVSLDTSTSNICGHHELVMSLRNHCSSQRNHCCVRRVRALEHKVQSYLMFQTNTRIRVLPGRGCKVGDHWFTRFINPK